MSRLGKLPIKIPTGTQVKLDGNVIIVKGPKGELKREIHSLVIVKISNDEIVVSVNDQSNKDERALWGLFRTLINNMVVGVNNNFEKKLEINGVGFRAAMSGKNLILNLGFSHPVEFPVPAGINISVEGNTITVSGIDKELVGETSAKIRRYKEPEPYKGKGIKYADEVIRRKEGKTATKGA
ncbi:MAG: 50S ribosomal protein L6 [Patescibacteria group bacterium]|nr:50S ribosomal protein L6 [Patescibacteria group bacterium]MDD4610506.1 50S ribosomal protein L6 [Patescibacteria group bacterium]